MKLLRFSRFYCICVLLLTGFWVGSLSGFAQPPDGNPHTAMPSLYSAVLDYEAGWLAGTNPNGVWSYGWSSDLTTPITLFSRNWLMEAVSWSRCGTTLITTMGGRPRFPETVEATMTTATCPITPGGSPCIVV